jgi:hypothetical protein
MCLSSLPAEETDWWCHTAENCDSGALALGKGRWPGLRWMVHEALLSLSLIAHGHSEWNSQKSDNEKALLNRIRHSELSLACLRATVDKHMNNLGAVPI